MNGVASTNSSRNGRPASVWDDWLASVRSDVAIQPIQFVHAEAANTFGDRGHLLSRGWWPLTGHG